MWHLISQLNLSYFLNFHNLQIKALHLDEREGRLDITKVTHSPSLDKSSLRFPSSYLLKYLAADPLPGAPFPADLHPRRCRRLPLPTRTFLRRRRVLVASTSDLAHPPQLVVGH